MIRSIMWSDPEAINKLCKDFLEMRGFNSWSKEEREAFQKLIECFNEVYKHLEETKGIKTATLVTNTFVDYIADKRDNEKLLFITRKIKLNEDERRKRKKEIQ